MIRAALTLSLLIGLPALAQRDEVGTVRSVQNRQYRLKHELALGLGVLPLDAYYKGITAQLAYVHHFNDHFAWQVGRAAFSYNVSTRLRQQLERNFGVESTQFREVSWYAGSDLVWKPLYGKASFMNSSVAHFEVFALAGASGVKLQTGIHPAVNAGLGFRLFASEKVSLRFEGGNQFVLANKPLNILTLGMSLGLSFGGEH